MEILKIRLTIYGLGLSTYDLRVLPMTFGTVLPEIIRVEDVACSEGRCTLSLATTTVIDSVISNFTLLYTLLTAQK